MNLRALLVDDEPTNTENLRILLRTYCPSIEVVGIAQNKEQTLKHIKQLEPDVLFLDIEMPQYDGFSILEAVGKVRTFDVIFVTAFNQYALDAIKFSALDYLLKPIRIEELKAAILKLEEKKRSYERNEKLENMLQNLQRQNQDKKIAIHTLDNIHFVALSQIIYCQSDNNYTFFVLKDSTKIIASNTLKSYERLLEPYAFFRSHQSYLINLKHVKSILKREGCILMDNGDQVSLSRYQKDQLVQAMINCE